MNETKSTFWHLVSKQKIVVPILQRDYAQGREDAHPSQVRKEFIAAIAFTLKNKSKTALDLGLIYGSESEQSLALTLIDGQQRLTTLFLLHWYVASRAGVGAAPESKQNFQQFTYEVRASARLFCHSLAVNPYSASAYASPAEMIEDSSWFYRHWKRDPTVASMLVVIDEIHHQLEGVENWSELWNSLIDKAKSPIRFQVLPMKQLNLTDDIYIKMNSRGRALTEFETFKAWLQQQFDAATPPLTPKDWSHALDIRWLDLFWCKRNDPIEVGDQFLRFLINTALNNAMCKQDFQRTESLIKKVTGESFLAKSDYKELFTHNCINECFCLLECLSQSMRWDWVKQILRPDFLFHKEPLLDIWKNSGAELTLPTRVLFHGLSCYLLSASEVNELTFSRWMRLVRNLVLNSVVDNPEVTTRAIKSISYLSNSVRGDLLQWLSASDQLLDGINPYQLVEEKRKARLINKNPNWEILITQTENHLFAKGQIGFLLDMSVNDGNSPDLDLFRDYAALAEVIFNLNNQLIGSPDFLLERALLSYDDYLIEVNSNYSFVNGITEWKKYIFHDTEKCKILKCLLDELRRGGCELNQVRASLNGLINAAKNNVSDWRRYFIRYPQAISYCQKRQIRCGNDDSFILLLSGISTKGWYAELRSFCLMEELNENINASEPSQWKYNYEYGLADPYTYLEQAGIKIMISHPRKAHEHSPFLLTIERGARDMCESWHANEQVVISTIESLLTEL